MADGNILVTVLLFSPFIVFAAGLLGVWIYANLPSPKTRPVQAVKTAPQANPPAGPMGLPAGGESKLA